MTSTEAVVEPLALRLARVRVSLRQRDIAARLGVAPQRISDFEQGLRHPSPEQVAVLVKILGPGILVDNPATDRLSRTATEVLPGPRSPRSRT